MRELVRSSVSTGIALVTAGVVVVAPALTPALTPAMAEPRSAGVTLTAAVASPPPGALVEQFFANQAENCSQICPYIGDLAVRPAVNFALIPVTFVRDLQAGTPLLQAIARSDATVSGAAHEAVNGIITNDLGLVLPRAQHALEVAVVGLTDVAITVLTRPGDALRAADTARTDFYQALRAPLGTRPPAAVHNALEAAEVRAIEIVSGVTFQAPERLLLGVAETVDQFFRTVGETGDISKGLVAARISAKKAIDESIELVRRSATVPIPRESASSAATSPSPTATPKKARRSPSTVDERKQSGTHQPKLSRTHPKADRPLHKALGAGDRHHNVGKRDRGPGGADRSTREGPDSRH